MPNENVTTSTRMTYALPIEGRFYIGMGLLAIVTTIVGFGPALIDPASRKAPLTLVVGIHGIVFSAWLLLFVVQAILITKRRFTVHRQLGYIGIVLAVAMLVSGYFITIDMVRRGYDLSGDLIGEAGDPLMLMVFQLGDLLCFGVLVAFALVFRRRPETHKRLMLLATIGGLMPAALSHIIGHSSFLRGFHPAIILIPFTAYLFAGAVHDRMTTGRIHSVSLWGAIAVFIWSNARAAVIGPSESWHKFANWLIH
jgi:hypothetical protein